MSDIRKLTNLVEELAEIKSSLTDDDMIKFDSITIPHYIMCLKSFKENNGNGEFIDFLKGFWRSDMFKSFMAECESNGSGGSLYSAQSVENRQGAIDDYLDEYLDTNNGGENDEDNAIKEQGTVSYCTRDNETKECSEGTDYDSGFMQTDSSGSGETGSGGQKESSYSIDLSGSKQTIESV